MAEYVLKRFAPTKAVQRKVHTQDLTLAEGTVVAAHQFHRPPSQPVLEYGTDHGAHLPFRVHLRQVASVQIDHRAHRVRCDPHVHGRKVTRSGCLSFAAVFQEEIMRRCLQLARNGTGAVAPNPLVGAVLTRGERILAEGWHRACGGPHAEVECLRAFGDGPVPADAVMYVNLEPCAHHGRTPPCIDLLIARGVEHLVVGCTDPDPRVSGKGSARAREAGIHVVPDVLRAECRWVNRRFLHRFEQRRPYVVLKWARSPDGYLDDHGKPTRISSPDTDVLVHEWRSEEQAILVGGRTVMNDDPQLTVRLTRGRSPIRIVMDRTGSVPEDARVFDGAAPSLLVSPAANAVHRHGAVRSPEGLGLQDAIHHLLRDVLVSEERMTGYGLPVVSSVLVEGGGRILSAFLESGLWDELRVINGQVPLHGGTKAPDPDLVPVRRFTSGGDRIDLFVNGEAPDTDWTW